jgi:2-epi-5-epi-valiolone synthase
MDVVFQVVSALNTFGISRRCEPIIGIGGGVLLDIVGFAASLYRRGIPYIRIPTTLIALVDAGIGVKTGINVGKHKNRLGTYYPPLATLLDRAFLRSLDTKHISNGLAEILKMAIVTDATLFWLLEQYGTILISSKFQDESAAPLVLYRAIHAMLAELQPNLWEQDLNRKVDFGHTFSPALEMQAVPELLHGEAVAIDMAISALLAYHRGLIDIQILDRILCLMKKLQLPLAHSLCTAEFLYEALQDTILHRDGSQRVPLPVSLGDVRFFNDITEEELATVVHTLQQLLPS